MKGSRENIARGLGGRARGSVATLALCGLAFAAPPSGSPRGLDDEPESHRRMREELRDLLERTDSENLYVGRVSLALVARQLNALPADAPMVDRWQLTMSWAREKLSAGDVGEALEVYAQARQMVRRLPADVKGECELETLLRSGIASLVQAERENCVECHDTQSCIFPIEGNGVHQQREGSEAAAEFFKRVVRKSEVGSEHHLVARWLLNVAVMTLGEYPQGVPERFRLDASAFAEVEGFRRFQDVAGAYGLASFNQSGGSIVDDFDGDGDLDFFNSSWDPSAPLLYFECREGSRYVERSEEVGLSGFFGGLNLVQADYDNDGDLDVFVLRGAWLKQYGQHPNSLLRNDGERFTDVTFDCGLGAAHFPTQTAAWADFDLDGDLDLFVGNEATQGIPSTYACQLFRNDGEGRFEDVAEEAGVQNLRFTKGCTWGDFDGDRDPDLYLSNMKGDNRLYRNDGDGTFTDVAPQLGLTGPHESFPTWFWDYDNDGDLDLFVAAYVPEVSAMAAEFQGLEIDAEFPALYRNDGQGGFEEVGAALGLNRLTAAMGANFGDLDGDGFLDFYLGTGYPDYEALMPNLLFWNRGGESFVDATYAGGFGHLQKGHAISFADFDHDGDIDVFEQLGGAFRGDGFHNALFRNPGFGTSWITLKLVGTTSNRCAIGARIRAVVKEGELERSIERHVNSGGSFGASPLRQTIGLGGAERIERLEVHWPASDTTQVFLEVPVGRLLRITEGAAEYEASELPRVGS